jgi:hypothetical protein
MALLKRIICLANSRKVGGTCVAGKEAIGADAGKWVRPVSNRPTHEVSSSERHYQDGSDPGLLDIIDVPIQSDCPNLYQVENWLLDPSQKWTRVGQVGWKDLFGLADKPNSLWVNGSSTSQGLNDRVSQAHCQNLDCSLYLAHVDNLRIHVFAPGEYFGNPKLRVQAEFTYGGINYKMWITDPTIEATYRAKGVGMYEIGECFLTVSLGEIHSDGYAYKLVAAVITP